MSANTQQSKSSEASTERSPREKIASYFEEKCGCRVKEVTDDGIRLSDIPYSGGAHMLPGGMGALDILCEEWPDHDINYVESTKTHRSGRAKKEIVIRRT